MHSLSLIHYQLCRKSPTNYGQLSGSLTRMALDAVARVTGRQDRVNAPRSRRQGGVRRGCSPSATAAEWLSTDGRPWRVTLPERCLVADLLYALLLIGVFAVLAGVLRGLEKL
ncbi:predicted protein [Streptomyces sp. AA4]|nr:predicted protein [Streptomyces sp. AA4]